MHVIGQLDIGGCELQLLGLSRRLVERGHEVSVCCFRRANSTLDTAFRDSGVETMFLDKDEVGPLQFMRSLVSIVKSDKPDILHAWLRPAYLWSSWAAWLAGRCPVVASERSQIATLEPVFSLSARLLGRRVVWMANSRAGAASVSRFYGVPRAKVRVIHNGVSLDLPDRSLARRQIRQELGLPSGSPIVLMVASQSGVKDYPMFVRAAAEVGRHRQDVMFVGVGREVPGNDVAGYVRSVGSSNLRLVGERNDIGRWYAAADIFCLTSKFEGFPNAVLEAMYAGLPVICTSFPSSSEMISHGRTGYLVPAGDEITLASNVLDLVNSPQIRSDVGSAARQHVVDHYGWEGTVDETEALYDSILS